MQNGSRPDTRASRARRTAATPAAADSNVKDSSEAGRLVAPDATTGEDEFLLASCQSFVVERLSAQFATQNTGLLHIGEDVVAFTSLPSRVVADANSEGAEFVRYDAGKHRPEWVEDPKNVLIIDLGALLGVAGSGNVDMGSSVFQLNTSQSIFIFRASEEKQKEEICELLRKMILKASPAGDGPGEIVREVTQDPETAVKMRRKSLMVVTKRYSNLTRQYKERLKLLNASINQKNQSLKYLIERFKLLEEENKARKLEESLRTALKQNQTLVAKVNRLDSLSRDSSNRLRSLQERFANRKTLMDHKVALIEELENRVREPLPERRRNWKPALSAGTFRL